MMPRLIVVTDEALSTEAGRSLPETVAAAVDGGARGILFREKHLTKEERTRLASKVAAVLDPAVTLLVASDPELARAVEADGVHLSSDQPFLESDLLVGRSCHGLPDVERSASEGADYVTVSPVFASFSKPGHGPSVGMDELARCVAAFPGPVYALGGIETPKVRTVLRSGVHGVAVCGAVMASPDPARTVAELLEELDSTRGGHQ
jgi:thiamine-phosphate pyrophosphorylase